MSGKSAYWELGTAHWELWNTTLNGRTTNTTIRRDKWQVASLRTGNWELWNTTNAGKQGVNTTITTIRRDKWQVASNKWQVCELGTEHWKLWNTTNEGKRWCDHHHERHIEGQGVSGK
jgi:hypothetical protein